MGKRKTKLLFVISQFVQSGSERYVFEVCRALDKDKFDVEILTRKNINESDYYYFKLKELGFVIHKKLPQRRLFQKWVPPLSKLRITKKAMTFLHAIQMKLELRNFFEAYDVINIIQMENYYLLQRFFPHNNKMIIYLMSNRFQHNYDLYAECLSDREYRFVLMDPIQKDELADSNCANAETLYLPLPINFSDRNRIYKLPVENIPIKIGVFIRLSPMRPMEPLFRAFKDLLKYINATLHVYGRGDPTMYYVLLERLYVKDKVIFEGHQENIEETIVRDKLTLVWMTANGPILGYASIEVASFGVPIVFWSHHPMPYEKTLAATHGAVHSLPAVSDFVNFNKQLLSNPAQLEEVGVKLREYVLKKNNIKKNIISLQNYIMGSVQTER